MRIKPPLPFVQAPSRSLAIPETNLIEGYAPSEAGCFYTDYDGVGDAYQSTDAGIREAYSQMTWAGEIWLNSGISTLATVCGNYNNTYGIHILYVNTSDALVLSNGGGETDVQVSYGTKDAWRKFVMVYDSVGNTQYIMLDGVSSPTTSAPGNLAVEPVDFILRL